MSDDETKRAPGTFRTFPINSSKNNKMTTVLGVVKSPLLADQFLRQQHRCSLPSIPSRTNRRIFPLSTKKKGSEDKHQTVTCYNSSSANDAVVLVADVSYGNKQIICLTERVYDYVLSNVREPEILRKLREETAGRRGSQMQVSPDQAQLLAMLVRLLGAKRCIEVGVYNGYSSLAVALVLPDSGHLVACERDPEALEIAKRYYEQAGVLHKVDARLGMASDTLRSLLDNGEKNSYDFAFIDAEKKKNTEYFELLLELVRVGGVIVIDNVLWHGKVADPLVNDNKTRSIVEFNKEIFKDARVDISMVPIGDGMTICRKR